MDNLRTTKLPLSTKGGITNLTRPSRIVFESTIFAMASIASGFFAILKFGAIQLDIPKRPSADKYIRRLSLVVFELRFNSVIFISSFCFVIEGLLKMQQHLLSLGQ
jgi:hypothetical protein